MKYKNWSYISCMVVISCMGPASIHCPSPLINPPFTRLFTSQQSSQSIGYRNISSINLPHPTYFCFSFLIKFQCLTNGIYHRLSLVLALGYCNYGTA
ncbi:hypothetical protein L873DRAFT_716534 [Choiromyces venosus 120613-1]|uniref:Uncharacterized protein n=1 Tax=Choiromyces venosus 120613-1 TaxID=1336337 RepID=A0A3N4JRY0_9PEZI|nr:hypothetical protein L873DRAFT_716534 [Choiromyces venosus 120613-1]